MKTLKKNSNNIKQLGRIFKKKYNKKFLNQWLTHPLYKTKIKQYDYILNSTSKKHKIVKELTSCPLKSYKNEKCYLSKNVIVIKENSGLISDSVLTDIDKKNLSEDIDLIKFEMDYLLESESSKFDFYFIDDSSHDLVKFTDINQSSFEELKDLYESSHQNDDSDLI